MYYNNIQLINKSTYYSTCRYRLLYCRSSALANLMRLINVLLLDLFPRCSKNTP